MKNLSTKTYRQWQVTLGLITLLCVVLVAALAMGCEGDTITNNQLPPDLPADSGTVIVNTVNVGGSCDAVTGGTAIQCEDSSFCQSSQGVAERCSRIAWECENTATNVECGSFQNTGPGSTVQFDGLTQFTDYTIHETAYRENGDQASKPHNVNTGS